MARACIKPDRRHQVWICIRESRSRARQKANKTVYVSSNSVNHASMRDFSSNSSGRTERKAFVHRESTHSVKRDRGWARDASALSGHPPEVVLNAGGKILSKSESNTNFRFHHLDIIHPSEGSKIKCSINLHYIFLMITQLSWREVRLESEFFNSTVIFHADIGSRW